jgi:hypothetical protein
MHLQLASWKRLYPTIPLLIHDDSSDECDQIAELCKTYGASFYKTEKREGHQEGDLSACIKGLEFGRDLGLDIMVKVSRTWLPLINFAPDLQRIAYETQYVTFSNWCTSCGNGCLGFRTECVGWHVATYVEKGPLDKMKEGLHQRFHNGMFMELFMHRIAEDIAKKSPCIANARYRINENRHIKALYYATWDWMGEDCRKRNGQWLWHHSDEPLDYYRISLIYGLPYTLEAFENPPY